MLWFTLAAAYLIGSIPFGVLVAKFYKVDLRSQGSGNIGATNALRVIGKKAGVLTLLGDVLKGTLAVFIALELAGRDAGILAAGAAVIGHDFPVFLRFKGGKGVATSFGVVAALEPLTALIALGVWVAVVAIWKYSSLGALASFAALPAVVAVTKPGEAGLLILSLFIMGLAFVKHRANIGRLIKGEESRIGAKAV